MEKLLMTASATAQTIGLQRVPAPPDHIRFLAALAGVVVISIILRIGSATPDVSWLIDVCARILNGERGYIDVFETTPPVPTLLYMPGAWLEKYVGAPAELAVVGYTYLTYLGVLALSWKILPPEIDGLGASHWFIIFPLGLYLFVLTHDSFSQRETFAVALMTPMICALVASRQTGRWPALKWRALAVLLAGLAAAIKPPLFALPLLFCGGYLVIASRSVRPLYSSGLIATAIVFTVITAASLWIFPGYFDAVYPLMRDVYVPIRHNAIYGILSFSFLVSSCCLVVAFMRADGVRRLSETGKIFLIAAAGFIFAFFYQGKYFDYHVIPFGLFLFVMAWSKYFGVLIGHASAFERLGLDSRMELRRRSFAMTLIMVVLSAGFIYSFDDDEPRMRDRSWAESLDHPTAMAIASGSITGFPLAREIDARWVNRTHCQWSVTYPQAVMQKQRVSEKQRRLFKEYQERELERVAALVPEKKPEIIIESTSLMTQWLTNELLKRNPSLLDDYKVVAEEGAFRIWQRKVSAGGSSATANAARRHASFGEAGRDRRSRRDPPCHGGDEDGACDQCPA